MWSFEEELNVLADQASPRLLPVPYEELPRNLRSCVLARGRGVGDTPGPGRRTKEHSIPELHPTQRRAVFEEGSIQAAEHLGQMDSHKVLAAAQNTGPDRFQLGRKCEFNKT
jgi:hypothetical protein